MDAWTGCLSSVFVCRPLVFTRVFVRLCYFARGVVRPFPCVAQVVIVCVFCLFFLFVLFCLMCFSVLMFFVVPKLSVCFRFFSFFNSCFGAEPCALFLFVFRLRLVFCLLGWPSGPAQKTKQKPPTTCFANPWYLERSCVVFVFVC